MKEGELMEHDLITEVRSKVDIVDVISSYLPLTQKGKNYFGVCPFHDDTNPSMSVSRELQIYRCFSCGASGNVYNFVMNYEHISFKEALALLANKAGIELKNFKITEKKQANEVFYKAYELAEKFYQNNLNSSLGKIARNYLKERSLGEDVIKEFGVGLALNGNTNVIDLLKNKGYDLKTLNEIGLANSDRDTYFNRIMFPLHDLEGRIVGFSGRIYDGSTNNKYLNTKETPIFKKGQLLYHYAMAREEVRTKKYVIVMEGFMDVIRASTIGVKNTIALMGTAMTDEQAKLIIRLSKDVILCFDGDEAGRHATMVNGEALLKLGLKPKVIALTGGDDPDTFILKKGKEHFLSLIESAIPFTDFKLKVLKEGVDLQSEEAIAGYINTVITETCKWDDEIRQEIVLKKLAKEFNLEYNTLEKRFQAIKEEQQKEKQHIAPKTYALPKKKRRDKYVIAMHSLLYYMLMSDKIVHKVDREGLFFPSEKERILASEISYYYKKYGIMKIADFYTYLNDKETLTNLLTEVLSLDLGTEVPSEEVDALFKVIKDYNVNLEAKRLEEKMKDEIDPLEKAKYAERIRELRMGS